MRGSSLLTSFKYPANALEWLGLSDPRSRSFSELGLGRPPGRFRNHVPRCTPPCPLGAVKAVTAASLAIKGDGQHFVPLDACIETMRQTGYDMSEKYKETSTGGLAVNVVEC